MPQLTQPIFTRPDGSPPGVELAEAQQRSALAQYEGAIQTGFRDVSDALVAYQKSGGPRTAGVAGDRVARPKTPRLHEIPVAESIRCSTLSTRIRTCSRLN